MLCDLDAHPMRTRLKNIPRYTESEQLMLLPLIDKSRTMLPFNFPFLDKGGTKLVR
jgi:hypothetical protein